MILYITDRNIRVYNADNQISYNSDYIAEFRFDDEWNGKVKTARFIQDGEYFDIVLSDDRCKIPPLKTGFIRVGVFSDSMTSTYTDVYYKTSIKDGTGNPAEPPEDVYAQLTALIESGILKGEDGLTPYVGSNNNWWIGDIDTGVLARGTDGENGYTPVKGVDYFTEEEVQQIQNEVSGGAIGDFKAVVDEETAIFNTNAENTLTGYNANAQEKFDTYNANADSKFETYNTNAETKFSGYNTNAEAKLSEYNKNDLEKTTLYNTNADSKFTTYNENAEIKFSEYTSNAETKLSEYNQNDSDKTALYNANAESKLSAYDSNAQTKLDLYNQNATEKIEAYNSNAQTKLTDYNANADNRVAEFDSHTEQIQTDISGLKSDLAYMLESSENMLNPENNLRETYATASGIQTSSDYAIWFTTEKIKVVGGNVLQCNTPVNSIVIYNADGTSDKINSVSKLYNTVDFPFTLPLTADSVILAFRMTYIDAEIMVNMGNELLPYKPYGYKEFNKSLIDIKENPVNAKLNNANTTSDFLSDFKQSLAKNVVVNYVANFDTFNSLKIGYTSKDDFSASGGYTDYFEITPTQLIMHREDMQDLAWEHGLTIEKFIGVELSFDITKNYTLTITTIGGTYTKSNYIYLGRTYYPFAVIDGTNVRNNKLSATCKDFRKNIFAFGDSYFSNSSSRWMYYLQNKDSICINQYAGEPSASAIVDFRTLVKHGNPKFVLWCLGMNDGTDADENTPSSKWLPHIQEVIETCEKNNIVPILATIPSVPNISHKGKNKWVRESGYHYIDFAKAVEFDENGNWYSGLLSSDNVHPTSSGAKVLYARAIADFAGLLVIN